MLLIKSVTFKNQGEKEVEGEKEGKWGENMEIGGKKRETRRKWGEIVGSCYFL